MNGDYKELVEFLDGKFNKIDKRFENIGERFSSLQDIFITKGEFKSALENLATKEDVNNLRTAVDKYAEKADTYFQEMLMLSQKIDRHERWLHLVADKLGIKLQY